MKNIYLNIFRFNNNSISKAINVLRKNSIVGLPTETVYGLAGNAYSKKSINKIYSTKGRPKKNLTRTFSFYTKNSVLDLLLLF